MAQVDASDPPFFKKVMGQWSGQGQLTNASGEVTEIREEWSAESNDDGTFVFAGTRRMGDKDQEFSWVFIYNVSTDLFECEYWHTGMEDKLRCDVVMLDDGVELRAPFGTSGGELLVVNTLSDNEMTGTVSLTNQNGEEALSGTVIHRKQ